MKDVPDHAPLVLDVDGTLLRTDLLYESFWSALGKDPIETLRVCATNLGNRARLKEALAKKAQLRLDLMPVNDDILALANDAKEDGREVILASASDSTLVEELADTYEFSERVFFELRRSEHERPGESGRSGRGVSVRPV